MRPPNMAHTTVVRASIEEDQQTTSATTEGLPSASSGFAGQTSAQSNTQARGIYVIGQKFEFEGLSKEVSDFLLLSWRQSTKKQYNVYLQKWLNHCTQEHISVLAPSVAQILQFLWELFNTGVSYSTMNTARSALSTIITIDGQPAGQHRLVTRFLKSCFQQRPALPKTNVVWDADLVRK